MQPEALGHPKGWGASAFARPEVRPLLTIGPVWLILLLLFRSDWGSMFHQWWDISTYNHILLVPVILAWLAWLRLPEARSLECRPNAWGVVAFGFSLLIWLVGASSGFDLIRQAGVVAMLPASLLLVLGPRIFAAFFFPLCYMAFLVPFGDELVPVLQTVTAGLTVAMVQATQVPATIDGIFIDTPAGLFKVAEACSGVKFLVAMVALGVLVGNLCFRSWARRIGFLCLCIAVPILANGIRAWGTIYAAQYVGVERAAGIDHIIYGWIFFALVIAAVMAIGWRFFDRAIDDPGICAEAINRGHLVQWVDRSALPAGAAMLLALCLAVFTLAWESAGAKLQAELPARIELPRVTDWHRASFLPQAQWEPLATGAGHRLLGRYEDATGNQVDVFLALYPSQDREREAGGFGQGAVIPGTAWAWVSNGPPVPDARADRLVFDGRVERLALTYYRTGDLLTGSNLRLKLANTLDRMALRARPTAVLILSSERHGSRDPALALAAFQQAIGDPGEWMDRILQGR